MKTLNTLADLWQRFFLETPQHLGLDSWSIVFMARDQSSVLVSLANPFSEEHEEVFVTTVTDRDLATFVAYYKQRFMDQLLARFSCARPEVDRVLTQYPDWQTFYQAWFDDSLALLQGNLPLLFDFPSQQQYRAMQLRQADYAGYRRLLVVMYQYRKQQFQKVFIKAVDDSTFSQITQQMQQLYTRALPVIIIPDAVTGHA